LNRYIYISLIKRDKETPQDPTPFSIYPTISESIDYKNNTIGR
jgi:hypothetical protein